MDLFSLLLHRRHEEPTGIAPYRSGDYGLPKKEECCHVGKGGIFRISIRKIRLHMQANFSLRGNMEFLVQAFKHSGKL
jgi:hypothetical protein